MTTLYRYSVVGQLAFPVELLAIECAWPATKGDANTLRRSFEGEDLKVVSINMRALKQPERSSWRASGWTVQDLMTEGS